MKAYVVMIRERVTDTAEMQMYSQIATRAREGHSIVSLARYGALSTLEGAPAEGAVILDIPTMGEARRWYASDAYQEALAHRQRGAEYRVLLIEGLSP